jgi:tetratricopeptide (TPR) repeat protein
MKFQTAVMITGASAWMWSASAAPESFGNSALKEREQPLAALIDDLADANYQTRETASRKIWELGDSALDELKQAAEGRDPEQAYRARDLIRKIQLFITPGTDPGVIDLVERYGKASANEKIDLLGRMQVKRAWRQILKLHAAEKSPLVTGQYQGAVEVIAVIAARECLMAGNAAGAKEFLEMGPSTPGGLLSLADFHRSQGTLAAELKRAKTLEGKAGAAWRLALYRASGDLEAAKKAADEAGEVGISAALSSLLGDPLPWLRMAMNGGRGRSSQQIYADLAAKRWQQDGLEPADLQELTRMAGSRNRNERGGAMGALLALGEPGPAEQALLKTAPLEAFTYFESLERIPEAFKALGLDPEKPDFTAWVREHFDKILAKELDEEDGDTLGGGEEELVLLANFLEQRGLHDACKNAFSEPMLQLAGKDEGLFLEMLRVFFGSGSKTGAPRFTKDLSLEWAGEDDRRWEDIVATAFGENEMMTGLWDWLVEIDPKATRQERFEGLLALTHTGADPGKQHARWLDLAWKAYYALPPAGRGRALERLQLVSNLGGGAETAIRVWNELPETARADASSHTQNLTAAGRWKEAADVHLKSIENLGRFKLDPPPQLHASAAACLRRAGREAEAAEHDAWVEKLALGRDGADIGNSYAEGGDFERAGKWWARAVCQSEPASLEFSKALELHGEALLMDGEWLRAAAVSEVMSRVFSQADLSLRPQLFLMVRKFRFQSDMAKALADVKSDRAGAIRRLGVCHRLYPTDSGLADYFYPAVRAAGLVKEHDAWFASSWQRMMATLDAFPDSDNSANTTGWLASRACRKLDEAETLLEKALAVRPRQAAYLDTMAEIQFAKGNRQKALEWSAQAVDATPEDPMLRRQNERFRTGKLPR